MANPAELSRIRKLQYPGEVPRRGYLTEKVVASIEAVLGGRSVRVEAPAYLYGHLSGSKREIDVAIVSTIGSCDILAIVEVRDHNRPQGPAWIEQVSAKRRDVRAHVAVAVSASGFTRGAISLAAREGVELRTLASVEAADVPNRAFWKLPKVHVITNEQLRITPLEIRDGIPRGISFGDAVLFDVRSDAPLNPADLRDRIPIDVWRHARQEDRSLRTEFRIRMPRPDGFSLDLRFGSVRRAIDELYVDYRMNYTEEEFLLSEGGEYFFVDGTAYAYLHAKHPAFGNQSIVLVVQTAGERRAASTEIIELPPEWA